MLLTVGASDDQKAFRYESTDGGTTFVLDTSLIKETTEQPFEFGFCAAASGEWSIVGAYQQTEDPYHEAGAAYVYVRSNDSWVFQAYIKSPNAGTTLKRWPRRSGVSRALCDV